MECSGFIKVFFTLGLILSVNARFSKDSACGVTKGCFSDCRSFDGCTYLVTWAQTSTGVDFTLKSEILSSGDTYIAVGFSSDEEMGEDSVTECVMTNGNTFNAYNSYNPDDDSNERTASPTTDLSSINGTYIDGILECAFKRANTTSTGDSKIYSLLSDWYLFWAIGEYETDENEMEEHEDYGISSKVVDLQSYEDVTEKKKPKVKAHGCLCIVAWIGFTSVATILAGHYKPMWPSKKIFGTPIWLQVHRALLIGAVGLNLIAIIVIFHGEFKIYGAAVLDAHPVIGMIVTVVSVLQVIGGFLRPDPKHKFRPIFKWGHMITGILSQVLAVLNIGIGLATPDAHVPFEIVYALITFVIYQVAFEVTLRVVDGYEPGKEVKTAPATSMKSLNHIKLEEESNGKTTPILPEADTEPHCGRLKNILFFVHIFVVSGFTLGLMITLGAY